jgi:hypothetical protein
MDHDDAWDMPLANWVQQGSFVIPEIPPVYEPDAAPLVCLPAVNRYWMPYVLGALDQLRNPSAWLVADDDAMYNTLGRVSKLKEMLGIGVPCMSYLIRFDGESCQLQQSTDGGTTWTEVDGWSSFVSCLPPTLQIRYTEACALQQSTDGGTTWTDVTGWEEWWASCVQAAAPIVGLPPNPQDQAPDQLSCSIAFYLANEIILASMSEAVTAIQDDLTLLTFGANVLTLIPEFTLVALGYDAIATIYGAVSEGTLADYEAALTDTVLWDAVQCAIVSAITADGYVTPGNIANVLSAVCGISYTSPAVVAAICSYITSLGAVGLAQISQGAGLVTGADCSGCGTWCYAWSDGLGDFCGDWIPNPDDPTESGTCSGSVWTAQYGYAGYYRIVIGLAFSSPQTLTQVGTTFEGYSSTIGIQLWDAHGGTLLVNNTTGDSWTGSQAGVGWVVISSGQPGSGFELSEVVIRGPGAGPYGESNCAP